MEEWKKIECSVKNQVVLLRQNKDGIDTWELVSKLVREIKLFLDDAFDAENSSGTLEECVRRLQDLTEAYSSGDIIFLADVLEYEILDMIVWVEENGKYR